MYFTAKIVAVVLGMLVYAALRGRAAWWMAFSGFVFVSAVSYGTLVLIGKATGLIP